MTDQVAVVNFTITASGTFSITDPSITETFSAAILIYTASTSDGSDNAHAIMGIGFVAPDTTPTTEEEGACFHAQNGQNTAPNTATRHVNTAAISIGDPTVNTAATEVVRVVYSANVSGGVQLNATTFTGAFNVKGVAILFAGLTRAYTDGCTASTIGAAESVGGATQFQPDLVIFVASDGAVNTNQNDAVPNIGFALNKTGIPQVSSYQNWDDATEPSDSDGYIRSANAYTHDSAGLRSSGALSGVEHSTVTAFTATGFSHTSSAGSPDAHYLALKFSGAIRMACANMTTSGSTGNQDFTAFGFVPDLVLGMSTLLTSLDTLTDPANSMGYFATGSHGSRAATIHTEEGLTLAGAVVANSHTRQEDVALLTYTGSGGIAQRATWVSGGTPNRDGFRLNFTTATSGYLTALGIALGIKETESVTVSDAQAFAAEHKLVATESVLVSDALSSRISLLASESVLISDSFVLDTTTVQTGALQPFGVTATPGVARASTVQAGPAFGVTAG